MFVLALRGVFVIYTPPIEWSDWSECYNHGTKLCVVKKIDRARILEHSIERAHLWHPVWAHGQIDQLSKKLVGLLVALLARQLKAKSQSEFTTSVMTARTISSHESSCLPNYRPLNVSPRLFLGFLQSAQEACVRACSQCHDWRPQTSHCFSL